MDEVILTLGAEPEIVFTSVGGTLRVVGSDGNEFRAKSEDNTLTTEQRNGSLAVVCQTDCVARLPRRARLKILQVADDARIESLDGPTEIQSVGGDLILRQTAVVTVNHVGGDLNARRIGGNLTIKSVGGDLSAQGIEGEFTAEDVGGELHLRDVKVGARARAGGDVNLHVEENPTGEFNLEAGGDIRCRIPTTASARFTLQASGESMINLPGAQIENQAGQKIITLNTGISRFNLHAQGDIALMASSIEAEMGANFGDHWGDELGQMGEHWGEGLGQMADVISGQIESQIQAQMARFEKQLAKRLDHVGATLNNARGLRMEAMAERARQTAERAGEAARRRAERQTEHLRRGGFPWNFDFPGQGEPSPTPASEPVSNEERLSILRMLEQKKITAMEAEQLLSALEGR